MFQTGFNFSIQMQDKKEFIKEQVKLLAFKNVTDDEALLSSKTLDSIIAVDLAVSLEEEFKIKIPFTEINEENFDTVNRIAAYLSKKETTC